MSDPGVVRAGRGRRLRRWAALALAVSMPATARAGEVEVPLRLDYEVIRQALNATVFTGPEHTARLSEDGDECTVVELTAPRVDQKGGRLRARTSGWAELGVAVGDRCIALPRWSGTITLLIEVEIEPDAPVLHLRIVDSSLGSTQTGRASTERLWSAIKEQVHPRLEATTIDVGPSIEKARDGLLSVLPPERSEEVTGIFDSLHFGDVIVEPDVVTVGLRFELPDAWGVVPEEGLAPGEEPPLSEEELHKLDTTLDDWDSFATFIAKSVARDVMSDALRQRLLAALLATRHDLRGALEQSEGAEPSREVLRVVIERSWERIVPILRDMSAEVEGAEGLKYAGYLTAADLYRTLDAVAPRFGLDLSADGLERLARIVTPGLEPSALVPSDAVDPELRMLFGFGPPPPVTTPLMDATLPLPPELPEIPLPPGGAPAAEPPAVADAFPANRVVTRDDLETYLPRMRELLRGTARETADARLLEAHQRVAFQWLVLATAWQESCWRQYEMRDGVVVPLRSRTGDVGLMQVNERVWRGFYDVDALRHDTAYNVRAGTEILAHYLTRYALPSERINTDDVDALARVTYSLYNGGPRRMGRLDSLLSTKRLRRVDQLFWRRYLRVRSGNELDVASCF